MAERHRNECVRRLYVLCFLLPTPFSEREVYCQYMTRWLAISNRTNSDVTIKKHLWGVPKRAINQISKTHPGDTLLVYVGQQVIDRDTTLPPALPRVLRDHLSGL